MGISYQEVKSVKKKSIILEKQENLEIQENSSRYRQRKRTITKERFYDFKEEQGKSKEQQNSKSNVDFVKHKESKELHNSIEVGRESDGSDEARKLLKLLKSKKQKQEIVLEKVLDTSQQLSHLEASIDHEIKKLKQQRKLLKRDSFSMDEKTNKRKENEVEKASTWADYLGDNSSRERQKTSREIAKEKYSLQHKCVCTSPRYGSDKNLSPRPRMRSVASQMHTPQEFLDQGAVGDYNSNANVQTFKVQEVPNRKGFVKCSDPQISKANDQIVNCCYGLVCPAADQQTLKNFTNTNGQGCRHYSCQQNTINGNRAYTYCRDEYYYNLPNCSCNLASTTGAQPQQYRRHNTDLNTQEFYCRRPDKSSKLRSNSKTNKKSKLDKSTESLDDYNVNKKRAGREKREKQQRSKSPEQRLNKSVKLAQLLREESVTKLIKYLDRYVDDYEKEFELENNKETKTKEYPDDSCTAPTLKIKSHTKLCQVTVRKKLEQKKHPSNLTDCGDSNSLETQYSWETLRMLKKMTIREYKPSSLKAKEKSDRLEAKTTKELQAKKLDKVQRYREYLDKFEREQQAKKNIKVLKPVPEYFPESDSEELEIFKQLNREQTEPLKSPTASSNNWEFLEGRKMNSSLINKANFSFDQGAINNFPESDSYEESRYEYAAAARGEDSWLDQNQIGQAKRELDLGETKEDINYPDNSQEWKDIRGQTALKESDSDILRESRCRDHKAEDQISRPKDYWNYRKSKDRERTDKDPSARSATILMKDFKERAAEDQQSQRAYKPKDCWTYRKSRDKEINELDHTAKSAITENDFKERRIEDHRSKIDDSSTYRKSRERARKAEYQKVKREAEDQTREAEDQTRKAEDHRYERDNCSSYRKSIERKRRAEDSKAGEATLIPHTNFETARTACSADDFDFYGKSKNRDQRSEDQTPRYDRGRRNDLEENSNQLDLERVNVEDQRYERDNCSSYRKSIERKRRAEGAKTGQVALIPETNFETLRTVDSAKEFDFYGKSKDREQRNKDQTLRYSRERKKDLEENSNQLDLEKVKVEDIYNDKTFRPSTESPRITSQQTSRYNDQTRRPFKEAKSQTCEYFEQTALERAQIEPECREETFRQFGDVERRSQDQSSNNFEGNRAEFTESMKHYAKPSRESQSKEAEAKALRSRNIETKEYLRRRDCDAEVFEETTAKPLKAKDNGRNDFEDKRRDSEDQNNDLNDYKERRRDSLEVKQYPKERDLKASDEAKYEVDVFENLKERRRIAKDRISGYYDETKRVFKDSRQVDTPNRINYKAETKEIGSDVLKTGDKYYEATRREIEEQIDLPEGEQRKLKIDKYEELDKEELNKLQPETWKRSKRCTEENFSYDKSAEREPSLGTSIRKESQMNNQKQEYLRAEEFQAYHLKQEQQIDEEFSKQNESFQKEPERYVNDDPGFREKNSNSSSYDDFKQVMDHSLGLYTSRASQTSYQFQPQLTEQLSSQTFTREKETPNENQDILKKQQTELPLTTSEALKYLKNFLKTYQEDSSLEGECAKAVTSAANELITKLSSCKSSLRTDTNSRTLVQEPRSSLRETASLTLEQKLTQDTQFKDLESTTDSSDPQLANAKGKDSKALTPERDKSRMETAVKDQAKEEPIIELIEQESYHYKSQPCNLQQRETAETYQIYEEYKENLRSQQDKYLDQTYNGEMHDPLPLCYAADRIEPCVERKFTCGSLSGPTTSQAFDPQLMPLKGILKPCRTMEDVQVACYDLESHKTTSVVSFGPKEEVNTQTETALSYKQGEDEVAQYCQETQQTIITKDELLQPITQQTKYQLNKTSNTKYLLNQDNQMDSAPMESYCRNNTPRLYTVELEKFKQCPCMLDTYRTMLSNYYKCKKN
ncbi:trichohyalin-like [Lucilia cuprina]|uniref:trichohyalin-like n=1 Tax=Lucilia cuprina TaxID=7375 RepID=UPI001F05A375|nr:trichohyalin-like [Lucilia cuprina]